MFELAKVNDLPEDYPQEIISILPTPKKNIPESFFSLQLLKKNEVVEKL